MRVAWTLAKIILFTLLGIVILLFVAGFFVEPIAKRLLIKEVGKAGKGQYTLQLDELNISLLQGNIRLSGIRFQTDTAREAVAPVVFAEARELSAEGFAWLTYLTRDKLLLDQLYLEGAKIHLKTHFKGESSTREPFRLEQLDIYPKMKGFLESLKLQDLSLNRIDFTLINISSRDTLELQASELDLQSKDIFIGADKLITNERIFYAGRLDLKGSQLRLKRTGSLKWKGEARRLLMGSRDQKMAVALEDFTFFRENSREDTLLYTAFRSLNVEAYELTSLQEQQTLRLEKVFVTGADIQSNETLSDPLHSTAKETQNKPKDPMVKFSLAAFLPPFVEEVDIAELALEDINYRQGNSLRLQGFALNAEEILLSKEPAFQENRFLHARYLKSSFDSLWLSADNIRHHLEVNDFVLTAREGEGDLSISQLAVSPGKVSQQDLRMRGNLRVLRLENMNTNRLTEGIVQIGRAELAEPQFWVYLPSGGKKGMAAEQSFENPDFYPLIAGLLEEVRLGELQLSNGSLRLAGLGGKQGNLLVPEINLLLQDVLLAKGTAFAGERVLHSRNISLDLGHLRLSWPDTLYALQLERLSLSTLHQRFSLQNLTYRVNETHKKILARPAYEELVRLENREFRIEGLQYGKLLQGQGLFASQLSSRGTDLQMFTAEDREEAAEAAVPDTIKARRKLALNMLNLRERLPTFIKEVAIENLDVQQVDFWKMKKVRLQNLQLSAQDIHLDSRVAFADSRFLHAKVFQAGFDSLWVNAGDPRHFIQLKGLNFQVSKGIGELSLEQLQALPQERLNSQTWLEAAIPAFKIIAINTRNLPEGMLSIGQLTIRKPDIVYHLPAEPTQTKAEQESSPPDLYPLIDGVLDRIKLDGFKLVQGDIRLAGLGGSYFGLSLPEFSLQMKDMLIGKETAFADDRILHSRNIEAQLADLTYLFPDKVYSLQVEGINLSTARKSFVANNFRYMYGGNFMEILKGPEKNEVYRFFNRELQARGIDYAQFFRKGELHVNEVMAAGMDIYVFKDLNLPEAAIVKPMPADMVRSMGIPLAIKEFGYREIDVTYEEMTQGADTAGLVTLQELQGSIRNMTNIREGSGQQAEMIVNARGKLQGQGAFESEIIISLFSEDKKAQVKGSLDTLDITSLNRILRFNSPIATASGILYKIRWDFEAGQEESEGDFELSYENLSVQLSEFDSPDTTGVLKDIASFLANKLVVDSSIAEEKTISPKEVHFKQKRNKQRSFFHYYAISLMAGFIEAIGVPFQ